jgi:hypothetical protein
MPHLTDYNATVVTPITDGISIAVPLTPAGVGLASVIVTVPNNVPRFVEIQATVGVRADIGTGNYLYRIFRGTTEIYYSELGIDSNVEIFALNTLLAVDGNASVGPQIYTLTLETLTPGLTLTAIGPVEMSASAFG